MKPVSETIALEKLHDLKSDFARRIRSGYEHRAKSCAACETPGACCLDAHFVNVHITRLEAKEIRRVIDDNANRNEIYQRVENAIAMYMLDHNPSNTYACPLFEKGVGCLVHERGKPLPCIAHSCYENKEDLPPDELLIEQEGLVSDLNELTYRKPAVWMPLPVAIRKESKS